MTRVRSHCLIEQALESVWRINAQGKMKSLVLHTKALSQNSQSENDWTCLMMNLLVIEDGKKSQQHSCFPQSTLAGCMECQKLQRMDQAILRIF